MALKNNIVNAEYFRTRFPDEKTALEYLDWARNGDGETVCPKCGSADVRKWVSARKTEGMHRCGVRKCQTQFSVRRMTIFENSNAPLHKWFMAAYHMMRSEGIGAQELSDELGLCLSATWFIMLRIAAAMGRTNDGIMLGGIVECDEATFGSSAKYRIKGKQTSPWLGKRGAFCMVERGNEGRAITAAAPDKAWPKSGFQDATIPSMSGDVLRGMIKERVKPGAIICTDSNGAYGDLEKEGLAKAHYMVNHSEGEYVAYGLPDITKAHTNTVESRWAAIKNSRHALKDWDQRYFQQYLDIGDFQWNETKVFEEKNGVIRIARRAPTWEAFETFIKHSFGKCKGLAETTKRK